LTRNKRIPKWRKTREDVVKEKKSKEMKKEMKKKREMK